MKLSKTQIKHIIISFVSILFVAIIGSIFVNIGMDWFNDLVKPSQWIPNIVIPIVWTIIYTTFAIINYLWIKNFSMPRKVVILMFINGILNIVWCLTFFTLKLTFIGNIDIILNLVAGYNLIYNIFKHKTLYGYILSIYPIWLSIATSLNLALWILN